MHEIQARLFNGFLDWQNNELVWFSETKPETQPEAPLQVLDLLVNEGQLHFNLGGLDETPEVA